MKQQVGNARALLGHLRPLFEAGVAALAQACARGGQLDGPLLDEQQVATFEIAWASADLLAAETALARLDPGGDALQSQLALIFAVDAIAALLPRLEALYIELGLPLEPLQQLGADAAWATLRGAACGKQALTAAGRALVAAGDGVELGSVSLDQSVVMAQDAFRRFAADVVAPQAEAIHRHDQTVPESLLQPMRDMGVFGLSIPESHGGTGPHEGEDATMLVVVTEALSEASLAAAGSLITRPEILSRALMSGGTA
ncbi:acyl-CoA dehydrogenase family protein, partial [Hydrogenophaga sp.]|uniref:acyl-CoA dehydrogenase family protein n=1 Tax=Hydrogenophaga sp. TaxID=1904254 RepID=UPI0035691606